MLAAVVAGGLWGAIAGVLKAKVGTNEVISTLLLSFVAVWMLYGSRAVEALLRQPMTEHRDPAGVAGDPRPDASCRCSAPTPTCRCTRAC